MTFQFVPYRKICVLREYKAKKRREKETEKNNGVQEHASFSHDCGTITIPIPIPIQTLTF